MVWKLSRSFERLYSEEEVAVAACLMSMASLPLVLVRIVVGILAAAAAAAAAVVAAWMESSLQSKGFARKASFVVQACRLVLSRMFALVG